MRRGRTATARLIYIANTSLDGYIEDEAGNFEWTAPDDEVFSFITGRVRDIGTYLYGRRLYESMAVWETDPTLAAQSPLMRDFAQTWQGADKIVYSTTLETATTARTRIERRFDPEAVRRLLASAERDITVGGAALAAHAFTAGLVDECELFILPVLVGGGKRCLPDHVFLSLELLDEELDRKATMVIVHTLLPVCAHVMLLLNTPPQPAQFQRVRSDL